MPFLTPFQNDDRLRKFIAFDPVLSDEHVAECLDPFIPVEIDRGQHGCVVYCSDKDYTSEFRKRLDALTQEVSTVVEAQRQVESQARFRAYYEALNLDDIIEIPGRSDGKDIVFRCRPRKDGTLETVEIIYLTEDKPNVQDHR